MTKTLVFQKDFNESMDEYEIELSKSCQKYDIAFRPIVVTPFTHEVEEDVSDIDGMVIAYGSNVMEDVVNDYGWKPGWFPCIHDEKSVLKIFGNDYINHDMIITNSDEYLNRVNEFQYYFIKPNDDKYFAGTITDKNMMPFVVESEGRHFGTPKVYDICISSVKRIKKEWRFFVVDRKIVTGSKYHGENLKLEIEYGYDPMAEIFAEKMIDKYHHANTFVIDIAKMKNGSFKVVEINCLNCSGLYAINTDNLVKTLFKC